MILLLNVSLIEVVLKILKFKSKIFPLEKLHHGVGREILGILYEIVPKVVFFTGRIGKIAIRSH